MNNYYKLVTDGALDLEQTLEYNVTVMTTNRSITLHIGDINNNVPVFHQAAYVVHVVKNNPPGASIA